MAGNPKIIIDILADASKVGPEVDKAGDKFGGLKKGLDKAATAAAGVAGGLAAVAIAGLDAARDYERSATTVSRVFGDSARDIQKWADGAASTVGVSATVYQQEAAKFGVALTGMGLDAATAATKTNDLITLAGDMALALGTDVPTATEALGAAMRGEFDSLQNFGVGVDKTTVDAALAAQGLGGLEGAAYDAAFQQELLNQVLSGAGEVYGGYRAETDTTAETQDKLTAQWDDAQRMLGQQLLPYLSDAASKLSDLLTWVGNNKDAIQKWLPWLAGAAGAIWVLNWAMAANPVVLLTLGILALVAVFYIFRDEIGKAGAAVDQFMDLLDNVIPGLGPARQAFKFLTGDAQTLYDTMMMLVGAIDAVADAWERFTTTKVSGQAIIAQGPPAALVAAPALVSGAPAPGLRAAPTLTSASSASSAAGTVVINVSGALDPDAVARQIQSILRGRGRRVGGVAM